MPTLRDSILKSNLRITPEGLVSVALFSTLVASVVSSIITIIGLIYGFIFLALSLISPGFVFLIVLNSPKISQSSRSYALDNELPFLIGFLEVLASGGVSPIAAMRRISRMDKIFPASSKEAMRILIDIDVFGIDPISALEKAAKNCPNTAFSEFLYGYTTVLKTGGDVAAYISNKMRDIMENRSAKIRRSSDTIGTMAEAYVTITAVLGISLFTLYQIQAVISHNQSGLQSLLIFSFIVVPLLSGVFLWLLDSLQTKQPFLDMRPYKVFFASLPAGLVLYILPIPLPLYLHVSIALVSTVLIPSVVAIRYSRQRMGLEKRLPEFIRDIAESRKIGLPPENSIEQLASRNYGHLSKAIKKMGAQLSWGISLSKVVSSFISEVNSWITRVIGALMVEVVDVGGGTVKSFSEMADFTRKINELEADKRALLRPYTFVIYMAGLLVVITTFLMVFFLIQAPAQGPINAPQVDPNTINLLLVAAVFQSWIVGLVAGKMGEGSVSDGFKHSLFLVILGVVAINITKIFIPVPI